MMNVIPQTREERRAMFMKMTKTELVEMLMNNQDALKTVGWSYTPVDPKRDLPRTMVFYQMV